MFFVPTISAGFFAEDYSFIRQHTSVITLSDNPAAVTIVNSAAILTGVSCILLGVGHWLKSKRLRLSAILFFLFGLSILFNGLYPMGSALHGLYGLGLSFVILPFVCCYELKGTSIPKRYFRLSLRLGLIISLYFWLLITDLDPKNYQGLTQKLSSLLLFGWIAYHAYTLERTIDKKNTSPKG